MASHASSTSSSSKRLDRGVMRIFAVPTQPSVGGTIAGTVSATGGSARLSSRLLLRDEPSVFGWQWKGPGDIAGAGTHAVVESANSHPNTVELAVGSARRIVREHVLAVELFGNA